MILDDIKMKLQEIDPNVFYGMVDNIMNETVWDYIVFERKNFSVNENKTGYSHKYTVHIIRENFIPEGIDLDVIAKMCEIPGMRLTSTGGEFAYVAKPNTNIVVEMLSLEFVKAVRK